jgi:hypothetical protein
MRAVAARRRDVARKMRFVYFMPDKAKIFTLNHGQNGLPAY